MLAEFNTLNAFWFLGLGFLLAGYAVLDGFDLGVGILHLLAKTDQERQILMRSIGPLWDGNEVWLVTFGGALFAAFPHAYATVFSGFYIPFMLVLFALIFRGVSLEFRNKKSSARWKKFWDGSFFFASLFVSVLFGVAVGNSISGIPIGADFEFAGRFMDLVKPYPLLVGVFVASVFALQGAIYLYLRTEGELQRRVKEWMWISFGIFLVLYMGVTIFTLVSYPSAISNFRRLPFAWIVVILNLLAIANVPRCIYHDRPGWAFISSSAAITALVFLFGMALFPNLAVSSLSPEWSLTIYNAASSQKTLGIMMVIALIGIPFVVTYTAVVYWIFRGKIGPADLHY